jgi:DNA-binding response OmpR family regulator
VILEPVLLEALYGRVGSWEERAMIRNLFRTTRVVRPTRVLVVDDDASLRETVRDRLVYQGWDIRTASDGREALGFVRQTIPDVMLLDIYMPRMDGLTTLECLRRDPNLSGLPVMVVTSSSRVSDITRAAACNVADYVTKPFSVAELATRIQRVLRQMKT